MSRPELRNECRRYSRAWHARGLVIARGFTFWGSSRNARCNDGGISRKTFARGQSRRKGGKKLAPHATASLQSKLSWSVTRTVYKLCRLVTDAATPAGTAICMSPTMFSASWLLVFEIYQVASWKMQIRTIREYSRRKLENRKSHYTY